MSETQAPHYAHYDPAVAEPRPVIGWYDGSLDYGSNLPPMSDMIAVTDEQWAAHFDDPSAWAVAGGALVPYTPPAPVPTPADEASNAINSPVVVVSTANPSLGGEYRNDAQTRQAMTSVVAGINSGMGLPGQPDPFTWPDIDGNPHVFDQTEFVAFATAVNNFGYACQQTILGYSQTVPSNVLDLDAVTLRVLAARASI